MENKKNGHSDFVASSTTNQSYSSPILERKQKYGFSALQMGEEEKTWEKFDAQPTAENGNLQQGNPSLQLDSWTLDGKKPVFFLLRIEFPDPIRQ